MCISNAEEHVLEQDFQIETKPLLTVEAAEIQMSNFI